MPYRCSDGILYHKKAGKWSVKQHCKSQENCEAAIRLLEGLEHGGIEREDVGKGKYIKKLKGD